MKKIGTSPPKGINIESLNNRENYLLSAAVAACVWLSGEGKDRNERKHLNRRKVTERLQRTLRNYQLDDHQIDFYCMRTTADYDYKPSGPSRKKVKPRLGLAGKCQTCWKKDGTERYDNGLSCGVHCAECFVKMVREPGNGAGDGRS